MNSTTKLMANGASGDYFGSVSLYKDYALIGAGWMMVVSGSAYIFKEMDLITTKLLSRWCYLIFWLFS